MNIGLVLSGGGVRGVAHIGAIKALEEYGIVPTHISGSSAGAVVGALYASDYSWKDILTFFKGIQLFDIKKYARKKPGFIDAEKFYFDFKQYLKKDTFEALGKKLTVTTTDILNGELTIFNQGELIKPVIASAAFPGIFTPVQIGDSYFIDGGALDNFPVAPIKNDCDMLIGVYANWFKKVAIHELKHSYNVVERVFKIRSVIDDVSKFSECDLVIAPVDLGDYGTFDKKKLDEIFELGCNATKEALVKTDFLKINGPSEKSFDRTLETSS